MARKSVIAQTGEGEALWVLGGLFEIKVSSADSGGELVVVQMTVGPNAVASPPHTHLGAESVTVLDGNLKFHIADKTIDCGPGGEVYIPRGTWEWLENASNEPARLMVRYMPGGQMDLFFREIGQVATARELPPPSKTAPDFRRIAAVAQRYGMELKPPPDQAHQLRPH
jgi:quercetin dioxygenase-like cupin family protein